MDFSALAEHQDMLTAGSPEVARLRADAEQLLRQIDERENLKTQKVIPIPAGMWNALFRLEPAGVVVKLSSGDNNFEVSFLRAASDLNLPVPQVFGSGKLIHATLPNACYFIMSYIDHVENAWSLAHSDNGLKLDELEQLGHDLGVVLAKLHTIHLGYITRFGDKVANWKVTMTDGFSPDWDHIAPNALFDSKLLPIFERILEKTNYFSFQDGRLIHCDLNLSNVLVDVTNHQLRAVIDPGGYAGMPMFDLGYAAVPWDHGFKFHEAMLKNYRQNSDQFDNDLFYTSVLVTAYRHERFHTLAVQESIYRDILPKLGV